MKNKNTFAKISAIIALIAIFGSVIGTGALVLFEGLQGSDGNTSNTANTQEISDEQLKDILKLYTGATAGTGSKDENTLSGSENN
ncbi:hypothetical protein H3C61_01795 [Candidatus Gracilibacteria bacterium]|nr:hypothetical protein [Candidatus Gracilibacteria bacterium]